MNNTQKLLVIGGIGAGAFLLLGKKEEQEETNNGSSFGAGSGALNPQPVYNLSFQAPTNETPLTQARSSLEPQTDSYTSDAPVRSRTKKESNSFKYLATPVKRFESGSNLDLSGTRFSKNNALNKATETMVRLPTVKTKKEDKLDLSDTRFA